MLFISKATLNNLGYPHYSTLINFTKATVGTVPFVHVGAQWAGATGVLIGQAAGTAISGILALLLSFYMVNRCNSDDGPKPRPRKKPFNLRIPVRPHTNTRG